MPEETKQPAERAGVVRYLVALALSLMGVVTLGGAIVLPGTAGATTTKITVTTKHNKTWGTILTLSSGVTVYRLTSDPKNKSVCTGTCATIWPPVVLPAGQKAPVGNGVSGLGSIERADGTRQVTYKGVPLYRFVGDRGPGQATGNIKDTWGQWWVVNPAHPTAKPTAATTSATSAPTTVAGSGGAY